MERNVSNMPLNTLYRFDDNRYVWTVELNETRAGNYKSKEPIKLTEVYVVDGSGLMSRLVSGRLNVNPAINDFNHRFSIFDYDKDTEYSFMIKGPFREAKLDEVYKLRDIIEREYKIKSEKK